MGAVTAALIGTFAIIILRVTAPQMSPLFTDLSVDDSAALVTRVRGGLEPHQSRAIGHLAATAVNGLKPQRVSIVDESGNLLADGAGEGVAGGGGDGQERQASFERRLREQIESIVSSVV